MVGLREIPRTAAFTWSPDVASQTLATGTKAGAVDEGFSNDTQLELWDLALDDTELHEIQPTASVSTDSRFNDIAWAKESAPNSNGVIAGALENGSLDLWDAERLKKAQPDACLSRTSKHSGSIKALQFNPFRSELLGTVGVKGELFISDVNNVGNPFRMGNAVARADDFECLDWNKRTSHIMVTGSSGGIITVWDIKNKRESLTLNNLGRRSVSAVAWDPVKTTRLITAIPNDSDPLILVWDLRNANAPERVLRGHDGGVLSLAWCQQDSNLLLSCGKDNRTICWNPQTGESLGEFPIVTNWTFQTRWNPRNPNFVATASFDGKISVNAIQNAKSETEAAPDLQAQAVDDEDFFSKAQSQSSGAKFSLKTPPKWLQRPCGGTFGFGGKIATFKTSQIEAQRRSIARISQYAVDESIVVSTEAFEASLTKGNLNDICDSKISASSDGPDRHDWQVIKLLAAGNAKKELANFLGFATKSDTQSSGSESQEDITTQQEDRKRSAGENNRLSAFFDGNGESDNFLSELAATKGAKTNNPFRIYSGSESDSDRQITNALLLGKFEDALDVCIAEGRISDAFMIAICGDQRCIDKVQKAYFKQGGTGPNYLRLLASIVGKNLWDLVHNADLDNWKEVIATICTYADMNEFQDLCETLGDRLEEHITKENETEVRKNAAFCFLAGSKLEKVVAIWLAELRDKEFSGAAQTSQGSGFSLHAHLLQNFIEKVTIFREVTQYKDQDKDTPSDWKLAPLYDKYLEYADLASAHGQLRVAERYLDLLPSQYAAAGIAKARVKNALQKPAAQDTPRQPTSTGRASQRLPLGAPQVQNVHLGGNPASSPVTNQYAPSTSASNPYTPATAQQYAPTPYSGAGANVQQQQQQQPPPPPQPGMAYTLQSGPPGMTGRGATASPSLPPPPSKSTNVGNWNDMPDNFFKPPTASRRGTPIANANGPYQNYQNPTPPIQPAAPPPKVTSTLGPPPKAVAGPARVDTPPQATQIDRPPSAANPYAPSPNNLPIDPQPKINRGPSPYNAPPASAPPSNRYAPAQQASSPQVENVITPSGVQQSAPPLNPYAPKQPTKTGPQASLPQQRGPPPSVPSASRTNGPPPVSLQQTALGGDHGGSSIPGRASASKYPAGDRSHIPSSALPIYQILNNDMQRVKSRAPASFKAQVDNTEKKINILFDHLNNEDLLQPDTVRSMNELAQAMQSRDYETAQSIHVDIMTNKNDQCGNWMVGVKRLIAMSRATP